MARPHSVRRHSKLRALEPKFSNQKMVIYYGDKVVLTPVAQGDGRVKNAQVIIDLEVLRSGTCRTVRCIQGKWDILLIINSESRETAMVKGGWFAGVAAQKYEASLYNKILIHCQEQEVLLWKEWRMGKAAVIRESQNPVLGIAQGTGEVAGRVVGGGVSGLASGLFGTIKPSTKAIVIAAIVLVIVGIGALGAYKIYNVVKKNEDDERDD